MRTSGWGPIPLPGEKRLIRRLEERHSRQVEERHSWQAEAAVLVDHRNFARTYVIVGGIFGGIILVGVISFVISAIVAGSSSTLLLLVSVGILVLLIAAVLVGVIDAHRASAWRQVAAERRASWEAEVLKLARIQAQSKSDSDPSRDWDDN